MCDTNIGFVADQHSGFAICILHRLQNFSLRRETKSQLVENSSIRWQELCHFLTDISCMWYVLGCDHQRNMQPIRDFDDPTHSLQKWIVLCLILLLHKVRLDIDCDENGVVYVNK